MDNITINDEGLMEVSPTASRDAQLAFIDQYRQLQGENTAQIGTAAHALGSDLTAQYGGLHGPSEYIRSRYQTPQTESRIAGLRTAAQLSALNQLMANEQAKWADRYNQAYRNYQKRANSKGSGSGSGSGSGADADIIVNELDEYDVSEDPFFKRQEQTNLYNQLMQKQAAERGMTVAEYEAYLNQQREFKNATNPVSSTGGIGAWDPETKTFNNGLGI